MSEGKRVFLLILIMAACCIIVVGITIAKLYRTAFQEEGARMMETAQSQARLIEAVARFDAVYSKEDHAEGASGATISQIIDSHKHYKGFGETGEFTLAKREGNHIIFLLGHRHYDLSKPVPVPFDSERAGPMRRALSGESGNMVGLDYRGKKVLAAYEPVAELNLGIVVKIDLDEIRAPFVRASLIAGCFAVLVVLAGAALFFRVSNPMIRRLQEYSGQLKEMVEERTAELARNYEAQNIINLLLSLSLKDISLDEILHRAIDLVLSIPWLAFDSRGCIFLVENDPEVLVMKAQNGLSESIQKECARVPYGRCICGRAALTGEVQFADCLDDGHEVMCEGIAPHGQYCVPFLFAERTLGVLKLYLKEGHLHDQKEVDFLRAVAGTLASIIVRKRGEEELARLYNEIKALNLKLEGKVKKRTRELETAVHVAEAANRTKSDFLASMSHELRTPLNAIIGFSEVLRDQYFGRLNEKQAEYATDILDSGKHLLSLINDILDLSKIEAGKMELELSRVSIKGLLGKSMLMINEKAMKHGIGLDILIPEELADLEIMADERKLKQIMVNLLSNAVKFALKGGAIEVEANLISESGKQISELEGEEKQSAIQNPNQCIRYRYWHLFRGPRTYFR